jgi:hypothetical protein
MTSNDVPWYYVKGNERVGPITEQELFELIENSSLVLSSYVWRRGFEDWKTLSEVDELAKYVDKVQSVGQEDEIEESFDWDNFDHSSKIFMIKTGVDRGQDEAEYGPFSFDLLKKLFNENRVNAKTFIYAAGMKSWTFIGDTPVFQTEFSSLPAEISDNDRRINIRRPFVAKILFTDNQEVYEGVCRDISIGGLQILVADVPVNVKDVVSLNVHPDNTNYHFIAEAEVVRVVPGNAGLSVRFTNLTSEAKKTIMSYVENS